MQLKVDIIITQGTPATQAAKNVTKSIPIIMMNVSDPVGSGLVASLSQVHELLQFYIGSSIQDISLEELILT